MASSSRWFSVAKQILGPLVKSFLNSRQGSGGADGAARRPTSNGSGSPRPSGSSRPGSSGRAGAGARSGAGDGRVDAQEAAQRGAAYAGDYSGVPQMDYSPQPDGRPDPGEIVWAWVPYEEDHSQGKDRPVLIIGRDGVHLLALMLTSKDHTRQNDRDYVDVGTGAWDRQGRPSEAKLDRILRLDEAAVRREGAVLDQARFDGVAAALRQHG